MVQSAGSEDMEKCKSVNEDVDANVNEDGDDENLDDEEEEEEEELDMVIYCKGDFCCLLHPLGFIVSLFLFFCRLQETMRYLLIPMDVSFKV